MSGKTPMPMALKGLFKRMNESAQKVLVIVTDGMPHNEDATKRILKKMARSGVDIYMLGIVDDTHAITHERLRGLMSGADSRKIQVIEKLEELPQAFFKLLLPRR